MTPKLLALALLSTLALGAVEIDDGARALRKQIQDVERAIDARFNDLRMEAPIRALGSTRGAYLRGYGAVFTLQINLAPVAQLSPFRQSYSPEERSQINIRKRQRLETLETLARSILIEETAALTALPDGEQVALAIALFHFSWEDLTGLPSQVVMSASKTLLAEARAGKIDAAERKRRLPVEYF